MEFKIEGTYPVLRCFLDEGESLITSAGNMSWMTANMSYKVHSGGGFKKAFGRAFSGEGFFQNTYTAGDSNQEIAFAMSMPGVIKHIEMDGSKTFIAQKNAFLASEPGVEFSNEFTKQLSAGFFGGEGFILQKFSGVGNLFLEADGSLITYDLKEGESLLVDQGNLFMFESGVSYAIETVKGLSNKFFGGEGFFLVKLTGPGQVVLQTLPISNLAGEVNRVLPTSN